MQRAAKIRRVATMSESVNTMNWIAVRLKKKKSVKLEEADIISLNSWSHET